MAVFYIALPVGAVVSAVLLHVAADATAAEGARWLAALATTGFAVLASAMIRGEARKAWQ